MTRRARTWLAVGAAAALLSAASIVLYGAGALAASSGGAPAGAPGAPAVGVRTLRLIDRSRLERPLRGAPGPRVLETIVRYPAQGPDGALDLPGATPLAGEHPLIVFAHGFDVTPAIYSRLLRSWTQAGYVVAAPVFPLEQSGAPGGPDEADVVNEPRDISFVISQLLAASAVPAGPLSGLIDPARIAVAGQSDGGEAALAAAYARRLRDVRVRAAVILSGAEMSGIGGYAFAAGEPALLAVQGTADTSNEPRYTYAYFRAARRPKYLLRLLGAQHLPPYTSAQPWLGIVEETSIEFLDTYLGGSATARAELNESANRPGAALLSAEP